MAEYDAYLSSEDDARRALADDLYRVDPGFRLLVDETLEALNLPPMRSIEDNEAS